MSDLINEFEMAKNIIPHLVLEIGYTRSTGYMVHFWDASGVGIKNAPKIFSVQSENYTAAERMAIDRINEYISNKGREISGND